MGSDISYVVKYYKGIPEDKLQFRVCFLKTIIEGYKPPHFSDFDNYSLEELKSEIERLEPKFYEWAEHFGYKI